MCVCVCVSILDLIYLLLEREAGREKERETNIHVRERDIERVSLARTPTRDGTCNPGSQTGDLSPCGTAPSQLSHRVLWKK